LALLARVSLDHPPTTAPSPLSLHDALPICACSCPSDGAGPWLRALSSASLILPVLSRAGDAVALAPQLRLLGNVVLDHELLDRAVYVGRHRDLKCGAPAFHVRQRVDVLGRHRARARCAAV